jgi:hypothetical protein
MYHYDPPAQISRPIAYYSERRTLAARSLLEMNPKTFTHTLACCLFPLWLIDGERKRPVNRSTLSANMRCPEKCQDERGREKQAQHCLYPPCHPPHRSSLPCVLREEHPPCIQPSTDNRFWIHPHGMIWNAPSTLRPGISSVDEHLPHAKRGGTIRGARLQRGHQQEGGASESVGA